MPLLRRLLLVLLLLQSITTRGYDLEVVHKVNCRGANEPPCKAANKFCVGPSTTPCLFDCDGEDACVDATLYCNDDADCLVLCNGKHACSGNVKLHCPKAPHFCGYYKLPMHTGDFVLKDNVFEPKTCSSTGSHVGKARAREMSYRVCGGDNSNVRGNGGRSFERVGCQYKSCTKGCLHGASKCKTDGDHAKAKCSTRDAWHNGKIHAWCDNKGPPSAPAPHTELQQLELLTVR